MSAVEIIKDLKAKKFKPLYLLQGEEPYFIDQVVDYIEHNVLSDGERGFNQTVLYGKDTDMATILTAAKRYPMMSDYQVIIVKEAQDLKWPKDGEGAGKEAEVVLNYFEKPLPSTILVLAYKYAKSALEDAVFCNVKFRTLMMSEFYSIINAAYQKKEDKNNLQSQFAELNSQ